MSIVIHGTGCCLLDFLYTSVDFSAPAFRAALSRQSGDGGLAPGKLVFAEDFEYFTRKLYESALANLTRSAARPVKRSLGGPSVISLAHAAQMLDGAEVFFSGVRGDDDTGNAIEALIKKLPFSGYSLAVRDGLSPRTDVLSDPSYHNGKGERTFINVIGAAAHFFPDDIPGVFFDADITAFGGTALLPSLHDELAALLKKAKNRGALTLANLVYDFRSELLTPEKWPLGKNDDAYQYLDILIADKEEALRTSGKNSVAEAVHFFLERGTGAVIVTEGAEKIVLAAGHGRCRQLPLSEMPVSQMIDDELAAHPERKGDTTGCGDNFAGGVLCGIAEQMKTAPGALIDLREAAIPGIAAGGFACFSAGGLYQESALGEKRNALRPYINAYRNQTGVTGRACYTD
ncbi:MAG: carbohydrate kinase family protein [Treponema sp.]|jgi:sugar/nucleoside kinase (ribokinase family)|nr:carbohydrate kinase family protein [Treponema sp.]